MAPQQSPWLRDIGIRCKVYSWQRDKLKARGAHRPTHGLTTTPRISTASRAVAAMDSCCTLIGQAVGWCMCAPCFKFVLFLAKPFSTRLFYYCFIPGSVSTFALERWHIYLIFEGFPIDQGRYEVYISELKQWFAQICRQIVYIRKKRSEKKFGRVQAYFKGKGLTSSWRTSLKIKLPNLPFSPRQSCTLFTPPSPLPPSRKLPNHCFQFLLCITVVPREIEDNDEPPGGGDSYMKQTGMLVGNFEFNP